jgi:hypothetical protein
LDGVDDAVSEGECDVVADTELDTVTDGVPVLVLDEDVDEVGVLDAVVVIDVFGVTVEDPLLDGVLDEVGDEVLVLVTEGLEVETPEDVGVLELETDEELEAVNEGVGLDDLDDMADLLGLVEIEDVVLRERDAVEDTDDVTEGLADEEGLALLDGLGVSEGIDVRVPSGDTVCVLVAMLDRDGKEVGLDDLEIVLVLDTVVVGVDDLVQDRVRVDVTVLVGVFVFDHVGVPVLVTLQDFEAEVEEVADGLGVIVSVGKLGKGVLLVVAEAVFEIVGEDDGVGDLVTDDVLDEEGDALDVDVDLGDV